MRVFPPEGCTAVHNVRKQDFFFFLCWAPERIHFWAGRIVYGLSLALAEQLINCNSRATSRLKSVLITLRFVSKYMPNSTTYRRAIRQKMTGQQRNDIGSTQRWYCVTSVMLFQVFIANRDSSQPAQAKTIGGVSTPKTTQQMIP